MLSFNLKRYFTNSVTVSRFENVKDDFGGFENEWVKKQWNIKCRIYGLSMTQTSMLKIVVEGKEYLASHKLIAGVNTDIEIGDKIDDENNDDVFIVVRKKTVYEIRRKSHYEFLLARMEAEYADSVSS